MPHAGALQEEWGPLLGNLSSLNTLNLSGTHLSGSLPADWGYHFLHLKFLSVFPIYPYQVGNTNLDELDYFNFDFTIPYGRPRLS